MKDRMDKLELPATVPATNGAGSGKVKTTQGSNSAASGLFVTLLVVGVSVAIVTTVSFPTYNLVQEVRQLVLDLNGEYSPRWKIYFTQFTQYDNEIISAFIPNGGSIFDNFFRPILLLCIGFLTRLFALTRKSDKTRSYQSKLQS